PARRRGARTVLVACTPPPTRDARADVVIAPAPGPEVLAGSTRLKAGTATKLVLNTLTTASMTRLGKVYGNRMVDMQPRSAKLRARAVRLVSEVGGASRARARLLPAAARGRARAASVLARRGLSAPAAPRALAVRVRVRGGTSGSISFPSCTRASGPPTADCGVTCSTTVPYDVPLIRASEMRTMSFTPFWRCRAGSGAAPHSGMPGAPLGPT